MTDAVTLQLPGTKFVLASGSAIRQSLLRSAGLDFEVQPSTIDEDAIKTTLEADDGLSSQDLARILAEAKAVQVSETRPGWLVLGCDQTLEFEGRTVSKSPDMESARRQLLAMRGKSHALHASAVLVRDGEIVWSETQSTVLRMRNVTPEFVGHYLAICGESVLSSVGGYQIESLGVHLFEDFDGDYFTILGLPLLPLLQALRNLNVVER